MDTSETNARAARANMSPLLKLNQFFFTLVILFGFIHLGESVGDSADVETPRILRSREEFVPYFKKRGLTVSAATPSACSANVALQSEIQGYASVVSKIVQQATVGDFKGKTFHDVAEFVDKFGSRITGSDSLEKSIDYVENILKKNGATNIQSETVGVADWRRGNEVAKMLTPREQDLRVFGLGQSVGTSIFGITAQAAVFNNYAELKGNLSTIRGKIAVLNYGGPADNALSVENNGYSDLAKAGARAALYRSAATFSLYSPHTRRANLYYDGVSPKIPIAYMAFEDGDLMSRITARGEKIMLHLNLQYINRNSTSRNLFGDIKGREKPEEFVLFSGHTDSWDVAQAIQDDAIGVFLPLVALKLLNQLNLTPRRTLRLAFWTAEEYGFWGSAQYVKDHRKEFDNLSVAMEADYSCLASTGLIYYGGSEMGCLLQEVINLVGSATTGLLVNVNKFSTDLDNFVADNIPVVSLLGDDGRYFWYHHTEADAISAGSVNSTEFDRCLALWTSTAYILADMEAKVSRRSV